MDAPQTERRSTRVGEPFVIRVNVNPTTGYAWQAIYDSRAMALVDRKLELGSPHIGGGGEEVLTFKPLQPGPAVLTLELRRPWEKAAVAHESRTYDISVDP